MNRDMSIKIRVSPDEYSRIKERSDTADMNISSYIRNMALNGKIVRYDTEKVYEHSCLLRQFGNNLNQIAVRLHSDYPFYDGDMASVKSMMEILLKRSEDCLAPLKYKEV